MRTCKRCKKEKPENDFRGENKNCNSCLDKIKVHSKKYQQSEKGKAFKKKSFALYAQSEKGKEVLKKGYEKMFNSESGKEKLRERGKNFQQNFRLKISSNKIDFSILESFYKQFCFKKNIPYTTILNKIGATHFREKHYYAAFSATILAIMIHGDESDKQEFLNLLNNKQ